MSYEKKHWSGLSFLALIGLALAGCGGTVDAGSISTGEQSEPIINGTPVTQETDGVVLLTWPGSGQCTGTLMTNSWVLTAKHCVTAAGSNPITVKHEQPIGTFTSIPAAFPVSHPTADVALIRTVQPFNVFGGTNTVNNVLNLMPAASLVGKTVTCYGYGANALNGTPPNCGTGTDGGTFRKASLGVIASDDSIVTVTKNASGQTPFHGDSGGPCFYDDPSGYRYQVGVCGGPANGETDCNPVTTAYASATGVRDWVEVNMHFADESLGGVFTSGGAIANYGPNTLELVGRGTDSTLFEKQWTGSGWTGWRTLGGIFTSDPGAASFNAGTTYVFGRGTDNSFFGQALPKTQAPPGWATIGGVLTSDPAVVSTNDGKVWVFGRGTDNALWYRTFANSAWSPWASLGGVVTSDPAGASMATGIVHVFYLTTGNKLEYKWYSPSTGWSGPNSVDNTALGSAPAVTSSKGNRLDLFVKNTNGTISYRKWYGTWAPTWNNFGHSATSNLAVTSWGTGRMDVIFRGPSNDMRHFFFGG